MTAPIQFPYLPLRPQAGPADLFPILPVTLDPKGATASVHALIDTGASVNILPYDIGIGIGLDWQRQRFAVHLGGMLTGVTARAAQFDVAIGTFPPASLIFAWVQSNQTPLIFGQTNFFLEFDVCLFRSAGYFEVKPKP